METGMKNQSRYSLGLSRSSSLSRFVSAQLECTKCTKARAADSWLGFSPQTESRICVDSGNATSSDTVRCKMLVAIAIKKQRHFRHSRHFAAFLAVIFIVNDSALRPCRGRKNHARGS